MGAAPLSDGVTASPWRTGNHGWRGFEDLARLTVVGVQASSVWRLPFLPGGQLDQQPKPTRLHPLLASLSDQPRIVRRSSVTTATDSSATQAMAPARTVASSKPVVRAPSMSTRIAP